MSLTGGQLLLHYRIVEKIGEGGMGAVWKAVDTTLDREVAIKVLPEQFALDAERLSRFEREARLLASLNHPNIAAVYGLHHHEGIRFLAMELVQGEDLQVRLERGPLPLDDALSAARQITEALEAAHDNGVIHRDLKPANVVINNEGQVKVLDFGLAKALDPSTASGSADPAMSPTLTSAGTVAGVILGTAAYMSPEQARGHSADRRADIWSFGVLLYEMITGRRLFTGETISDTLAAVLRADVDLSDLPSNAPTGLTHLLQRCLHRDRKSRLQAIGEARIALERNFEADPQFASGIDCTPAWKRLLPWAVALAALVVAVAALMLGGGGAGDGELPHRRFVLEPEGIEFWGWSMPVISPDGKRVAYRVGQSLAIRDLDSLEPRLVPGGDISAPFWSPDSRYLAYGADGSLWKLPAEGGQPSMICELPERGRLVSGAWSSSGTIAVALWRGSIYQVNPQGGDPKVLLQLDPDREVDFHSIRYLPDGETLLFIPHLVEKDSREWIDLGSIVALRDGRRVTILESSEYTLNMLDLSPDGHLLYQRGGTGEGIWAAPFDAGGLQLAGEPFLVAPGGVAPSVAGDGTLIWVRNRFGSRAEMAWVDRRGKVLDAVGRPEDRISAPSISPDGSRVAYVVRHEENEDIWVQDLGGGAPARLTFGSSDESRPQWSPDGRYVIFESGSQIAIKPADGTGELRTLFQGSRPTLAPDGRTVVYTDRRGREDRDILVRPLEGDAEPEVFLGTPADELGYLSPDGDYLAYLSDESGTLELYLTRFPDGGGKWQISNGGSWGPHWTTTGELVYRARNGNIMSVRIRREPAFSISIPELLIPDGDQQGIARTLGWDVAPDGSRLLMIRRVDDAGSRIGIVVAQNWLQGIGR